MFALAAALGGFQISQGQSREPVVMLFAGDLMLGGHAEDVSVGDTAYVFRHWKPGAVSDVCMANIEHPITAGEGAREKDSLFRMNPLRLGTMLDGGIDIVTAANNHIIVLGDQNVKAELVPVLV